MISGDNWVVHHGSCLDVLPTLADNSVDSIVTDPPYELGFMGKKWDSSGIAFNPDVWGECLRVLKPGGHLLAFGGSRTWHRIAVAIEDAGFEVRDSIAWLYGSGFPKSLSVSKAIDSTILNGASNTRALRKTEQDGDGDPYILKGRNNGMFGEERTFERKTFSSSTEEGQKWEGWGTALKPAFEPIVVARKPLIGTVAANVLEWGTGGLNIDGSRIGAEGGTRKVDTDTGSDARNVYGTSLFDGRSVPLNAGRWPANVMLDEYTAALLDEQSESEASRFFYVAKTSRRDRNEGLDGQETGAKNFHPTVKPTTLMRYLVKLVTPPGGTVLDPFTGSGSTGKAAILEGFQFIGVELTEDYLPIIEGRLVYANEQAKQAEVERSEQLF